MNYSEIECTRKCLYQKDGKCYRSTAIKDMYINDTNGCIFYHELSDCDNTTASIFWKQLSNECF